MPGCLERHHLDLFGSCQRRIIEGVGSRTADRILQRVGGLPERLLCAARCAVSSPASKGSDSNWARAASMAFFAASRSLCFALEPGEQGYQNRDLSTRQIGSELSRGTSLSSSDGQAAPDVDLPGRHASLFRKPSSQAPLVQAQAYQLQVSCTPNSPRNLVHALLSVDLESSNAVAKASACQARVMSQRQARGHQ